MLPKKKIVNNYETEILNEETSWVGETTITLELELH